MRHLRNIYSTKYFRAFAIHNARTSFQASLHPTQSSVYFFSCRRNIEEKKLIFTKQKFPKIDKCVLNNERDKITKTIFFLFKETIQFADMKIIENYFHLFYRRKMYAIMPHVLHFREFYKLFRIFNCSLCTELIFRFTCPRRS